MQLLRLDRRALIAAPLALVLLAGSSSASSEPLGDPPVHPNILLIVLDDFGVDLMSSYGESLNPPPTPVLDAMADNGVLFRRAWANTVCSPTRASILTGRHSFRNGVGNVIGEQPDELGLDLAEFTIPELLDTTGEYAHAAFGKWHLAGGQDGPLSPNMAGFSHFDGSLANLDIDTGVPSPGQTTYFEWPRVVDGVESASTQYLTSGTVDAALAWVGARRQPWFAQVAFHAVHTPYHWPPAALHSVDIVSVPSNQLHYWQHRAMVESLDAEVGRLVAGLGPQAASTVIIVVGDNGTASPGVEAPFLASHAKHTLYDGGVRVPLLISGANVATPGESTALVQALDIFATVADLAGIDPAVAGVTLDSLSLVPYMADPAAPSQRAFAFTERFTVNGPGQGQPSPGQFVAADPGLATLCQEDLGFAGPGPSPPLLMLCGSGGQGLTDGNLIEISLTGAPPFATAALVVGTHSNPTPFLGGSLVPLPIAAILPVALDGAGAWTQILPGALFPGFGAENVVLQGVVQDFSLPQFYAMSNAIKGDIPPFDTKAAVDEDGYKLIVVAYKGKHELYHLPSDPFEQVDLLAAGEALLGPEAAMHLGTLRAAIIQLIASEDPGP